MPPAVRAVLLSMGVMALVAAFGVSLVRTTAAGREAPLAVATSALASTADCQPIEEAPESGIVGCAHADAAPAGGRLEEPELAELHTAMAADGSEIVYGPAANGGTLGIPCEGDGRSGNRIQALYVYPAGRPDRSSEVIPLIRQWAADVDRVVRLSAAQRNARRHFRWAHNASCVLSVGRVGVSSAAATSFSRTVSELAAKGFRRADRRYLIWMDADRYCGIGRWINDDRPWRSNRNNGAPYGPSSYARTDVRCWGLLSEGESVEAHELMHTIGAVQNSAPRSTLAGHCRDEYDIMCYLDGGRGPLVYVCPVAEEAYLDCGKNDYFDPRPPAGSYLATRWNTARSSFMSSTVVGDPLVRTASQVIAGPGATPGTIAVRLTWAGVLDAAAARAEIEASIDGGAFVTRTNVAAPGSEANIDVEQGRQAQLRLRVVDATGRWSPWWVFPRVDATADDAPTVIEPPEARVTSSDGAAWTIEVVWLATDDGAVVANELQEQTDGGGWMPVGTSSQQLVTLVRAANHTYRYRVRVQDDRGQWSAWVEGGLLQLTNAAPVITEPPTAEIASIAWALGEPVEVVVTWASDDDASVPRHELEMSSNGGTWSPLALPDASATSWSGMVPSASTLRWRVRALDATGSASAWAEGPPLNVAAAAP